MNNLFLLFIIAFATYFHFFSLSWGFLSCCWHRIVLAFVNSRAYCHNLATIKWGQITFKDNTILSVQSWFLYLIFSYYILNNLKDYFSKWRLWKETTCSKNVQSWNVQVGLIWWYQFHSMERQDIILIKWSWSCLFVRRKFTTSSQTTWWGYRNHGGFKEEMRRRRSLLQRIHS